MLLGENLSKLIFGDEQQKTASHVFDYDDAVKIADGLSKIASIEVDPSTYPSLVEVVKTASACIRELSSGLEDLRKEAEIRTIIDDMINIGLTDETNVVEKIAELKTKSPQELTIVKEAMKMGSFIKEGGDLFQGFEENTGAPKKQGMFEGIL